MNATEPIPQALETPSRRRVAACLRPPGQGLRLEPVGAGDPTRAELESYVRRAFRAKHGAVVYSFMPTLLAFRDRAGALRGVTGVRGAHEGTLYLEQYLDSPVDEALAAAAAARGLPHVARHDVVEVGNLAGTNCRTAVRMVAHLPAWLVAHRYEWIVFTATSALRQILAGLGAPLLELARADGAQVVGSRDEWGRYYETDPRVYAGYLRDAEGLAGFARLGR